MRRLVCLLLAISCVLFASTTVLAAGGLSVGGKVGTLGIQIEAQTNLSPQFNARLAVGGVGFTYGISVDDINYDFDMSLYTAGAFLDWHPGGGVFRFTVGVIGNSHNFDASAGTDPNKFYQIGDASYPGALLGTLHAEAEFNRFAPYVGIGLGQSFGVENQWGVQADLGVMYWGEPDVSLRASNSGIPGLEENLKREESRIEDELKNLRFYPVLTLGVYYRF